MNLAGKMVLPGFQDAHLHPLWAGVEQLHCALYDLPTREAYARAVAECAARDPKKEWIHGAGWDMGFFPGGIPTRHELDAAVSDRPVFLVSKDGHTAWVNSKALEVAGITRETPDPARGRIDRDKDGEPIGSLQESAIELVQKLVPGTSFDEARQGLKMALQKLNAFGITSMQEASVDVDASDGPSVLDVYRDVDRSGALTMRVVVSLTWDPEKGDEQVQDFVRARREYTEGRVRAHTVKIFQDGVIESKTAAVLEPYRGTEDDRGMALIEPKTLERIVVRLDKEGFQLHFHAIGDAAIRQVLDALEAARSTNGARDSRHHLSHIELFHPDDIPRFRELGAVANFQPLWALADSYINELTLPLLPHRRRTAGSTRSAASCALAPWSRLGATGRSRPPIHSRRWRLRCGGPTGTSRMRRPSFPTSASTSATPSPPSRSTRPTSTFTTTALARSNPANSPTWWCSTETSSPSTRTRSPKRRFS